MSIDGGINFFDTADNYTEGESEKILGQSLKNLNIARKDVVIAAKVYRRVGRGGMTSGLLAATSWTVWRPVSAVCRPIISICTRSMATIP
jgi:aryl-alcohol dehydrogenase-like predicted oxidoreductase